MVATFVLCLSSVCFLLLLGFSPGFDAQFYTTTPYVWSSQPYYSTPQTNSYNCGPNIFNESMGNITSPNYPDSYDIGQFCTYFIVAPSLSTINFTISQLSLEFSFDCAFDWIEFTCQSNSIRRTIRYCGFFNDSEVSFKPCSRVIIRFSSDSSNNFQGFFVYYEIEPIRCQGNCSPVAIGAGYNCSCDANQTNPFITPPYDQCPVGCGLSTYGGYCSCSSSRIPTTTSLPPTPPSCPAGCYPYWDRFGYPVCFCNTTVTTPPSLTTPPSFECPYGCYLGQDSYGYPICRCEGTTTATPCPFGCYNVTFFTGYSYCECSSPQSTVPLTATCPSGCYPDRDDWFTPYCRCNSSYPTATPLPTTRPPCYYPCYYQYDLYNNPTCVCGTNNSRTTETPCNYPCYYAYDNNLHRYCSCGISTTVAPCYYPCRYDYDEYGRQYCSCNTENTTDTTCYYPCQYDYDDYGGPYCNCSAEVTIAPLPVDPPTCSYPCRLEYDSFGRRQYCSCSTTMTSCYYPCYWAYDTNWNTVCLCNYTTTSTTTQTPILAPGCNVTQNSAMGTLQSPNYPNSYPYGINCIQTISVPMANSIQLMFLDLNVYYGSAGSCVYDWVEIRGCDGSVMQYCSPNIVNYPLEFTCTESYNVTVLFHSYYYSYGYRGFRLNYRTSFGSSCNSTGGGLVSLGGRGNIVSPNYPGSFPLNNDCYYLLQSEERNAIRIRVAFESLMMQESYECMLDYIKLNCLDGSGEPWFVCGSRIPSPVTFNCSSVEVQFHSEKPYYSSGRYPRLFKIVYYGIEGPNTSVSSAVSLRSRLGLSGLGEGAGGILLLLFVTLAMKTVG